LGTKRHPSFGPPHPYLSSSNPHALGSLGLSIIEKFFFYRACVAFSLHMAAAARL
jgi:hypothetical protein